MIPHRAPRHRPPSPLARRLGAPAPIDGASALPADVVRALRLVVAELRDLPREAIIDRGELVHWLGGLARRLEALAASKARPVAVAPATAPAAARTPPASPAAALVPAPAVHVAPASSPRPRRHAPPWRAVPIAAAARRVAEAAGQLRLFD